MCLPTQIYHEAPPASSSPPPPPPPRRAYLAIALSESAAQIEWAVQYVFFTPLLLRKGASADVASAAWLFSPLLGLVLSPRIGRKSDRCRHGWGRRRPFLAATSAIAALCLLVVPFSADFLGGGAAVAVMIVANVALDATNNLHDQLLRSMATDLAPSEYQATMHGLAGTSVGLGNVVGSIMGSIDYSGLVSAGGRIGSETVVFVITTVIFCVATAISFLLADEKPYGGDDEGGDGAAAEGTEDDAPDIENSLERGLGYRTSAVHITKSESRRRPNRRHSWTSPLARSLAPLEVPQHKRRRNTVHFASVDSWLVNRCSDTQHESAKASRQFSPCSFLAYQGSMLEVQQSSDQTSTESFRDDDDSQDDDKKENQGRKWCRVFAFLRDSPRPFALVCLVQFLSYAALWPVWIYTTAFFAQEVHGGDPAADPSSERGRLYSEGVRRGSLASALLSVVMMAASPCVPPLVGRFGLRSTFAAMQLSSSAALLAAFLTRTSWSCVALIGVFGLSWAANSSIPFVYVGRCIPSEDVGFATSILFLFQTAPVILVSSTFGSIIRVANNNFAVPFLIASVATFVAGVAGWFVPAPPPPTAAVESRTSEKLKDEPDNDSLTMASTDGKKASCQDERLEQEQENSTMSVDSEAPLESPV